MTGFPELVSGRVSLIVPCYNVEKYLEDFIGSIISQTYKTLEIILVNDGANAATTEALRAAVTRLEAEGYRVLLIEQENKGLAGAVDAGLKHFTGEFLMWPDPDDWLLPHSIERRVQIMRDNPDIGLLRSNAQLFIEARQEFDGLIILDGKPRHRPRDLFERLLFHRDFLAPVCHMARSSYFLRVNSERSIYFGPKSSQDYQMLVPLVESFPVLQIPEPLAVYRIRNDSRSRAHGRQPEKMFDRFEQLADLTENTLPRLKTFSLEGARRVMNEHWRNRLLPTAIRSRHSKRALELIEKADVSSGRKIAARAVLSLRCNRAFDTLDQRTGFIASRLLSRGFDALVRMPPQDLYWGAEPLWGDTLALSENGSD